MNNTIDFSQSEMLSLIQRSSYLFGDIDWKYMENINRVVKQALNDYSSVFALRIDLRFANPEVGCSDSPTCFQRAAGQVMKRFIASLKSQLLAYEIRRKKDGIRVHPTKLRYVWVCEQNEAELPHYHLIIVLNKAAYWRLNSFQSPESLAGKIQKAWCSALRLYYPEFGNLVHFPENCEYVITRDDAINRTPIFMAFIHRVSYLAKVRTKICMDGRRAIGNSWW